MNFDPMAEQFFELFMLIFDMILRDVLSPSKPLSYNNVVTGKKIGPKRYEY